MGRTLIKSQSPCIFVVLADVEGLFGEDCLGGHLVHPPQVDPLAELEYASRSLTGGLGSGEALGIQQLIFRLRQKIYWKGNVYIRPVGIG